MSEISKYMSISIDTIARIFGIEKSNITSVMGADIPAAGGGDRGIFGGGGGPASNVIEYITISTTGDATDFGDLITGNRANNTSGMSNGASDRGIVAAGAFPASGDWNSIEYVTISVTSNSIDFGDLTSNKYEMANTSNGVNDRGIFAGGYTPGTLNVIEYITVSTTGDATDFGDLTVSSIPEAVSNATNNRAVFAAGAASNIMDYITISTTGNAADFGDQTTTDRYYFASTDNGTNDRGIFAGSFSAGTANSIEYITITSLGNGTDFGDLLSKRGYIGGGTSNRSNNRGVFAGGHDWELASNVNIIEYVTISTTGNSTDFGDLSSNRNTMSGCSNA